MVICINCRMHRVSNSNEDLLHVETCIFQTYNILKLKSYISNLLSHPISAKFRLVRMLFGSIASMFATNYNLC